MGISALGSVARAAYYAERREAVNQWDSVAEAVVAAMRENEPTETRRLRAAAEKARTALSDLLMTRDPKVYADALRALDEALKA